MKLGWLCFLGMLAGIAVVGCEHGHHHTTLPTVAGVYSGASVLQMEVEEPFEEHLPAETGTGYASLTEDDDGRVLLSVQLRPSGQRCVLRGRRSGWQVDITGGDRCFAAVTYNGIPIDANIQVTSGRAVFVGNQMTLELRGDVAAISLINGRQVYGDVVYTMTGTR